MTQPLRHQNPVRSAPNLEAPREHLTLLPPPPSEPMPEGALPPPLGQMSFRPEIGTQSLCDNDVELESTWRPTDVDGDRWWESEDAMPTTERQPRVTREWGSR